MSPEIIPLLLVSPLLAWMAISDFSFMRIPNMLILLMLLLFVLTAPVVLELDHAVWRVGVAAVVLVVGFLAFTGGFFAGGDVKALAALQLFVPVGREALALYALTFSIAMLAGILCMLLLKRFAWSSEVSFVSLSVARGYPMGISIALAGLAFPVVYILFL